MSSMYAMANSLTGDNISFMSCWNVAGAPANPKGITLNSYFPNGVTNAVFGWEDSLTGTCQYPFSKSKVDRYLACTNCSKRSYTQGIGKGSASVTALSFW